MVKPSRKNNGPVRVSGVLTAMFVLFWYSMLTVQLKELNFKMPEQKYEQSNFSNARIIQMSLFVHCSNICT